MRIRDKLSQLGDASAPIFGIASFTVGALTLVDQARLQGASRTAVRSAVALLTGWSVAASVDRDHACSAAYRSVGADSPADLINRNLEPAQGA